MGIVETKPAKNSAVIFKPERILLDIDVNMPVKCELNQMLHWKLIDVRKLYQAYQRRTQYPFLDCNMFCRIMPFSHITSSFLYQNFRGDCKYISIYELVAALTITAYATYINKMRFIYSVFDFDNSGSITKIEQMFIYEAVVMAFCKLTGQKAPPYQTLEKFTKILLVRTENTEDKAVFHNELFQQIEGNEKAMTLFKRFEPATKFEQVKEDFLVFKQFKPYEETTVTKMYGQLKRAYLDNNYLEADLDEFKRQIRLGTKRGEDLTSAEDEANKYINEYLSQSGIIKRNSVLVKNKKPQPTRLPSLQKLKLHQVENAQILPSSRPSNKLIFLKGQTLSRQQIFNFYEYFLALSNNNNEGIKVRQFFEAFETKPCMRKLVSSLFNYLDETQKGQVTFFQFLRKIYPALSNRDMQLINHWVELYKKTYDKNYWRKSGEVQEASEKKVLPMSCLKRLKEVFDALDTDKKGYLVFDDFKKHYKLGYTITEIENIFQRLDKQGYKKLYIYDFAKLIVPDDFTIHGIESLREGGADYQRILPDNLLRP